MTDAGGYMNMAILIEVTTYRNLDNTENPLEVNTDFKIIWRNERDNEIMTNLFLIVLDCMTG